MIWKINRHNIFVLVQVSFLSVTMFVIVHHHLDIVHHLYDNYLLIVHLLTPVSLHPPPRAGKLQSAGHLRIFSNKFLTFTCYLMIELQSSCFNFHLLQNRQYCLPSSKIHHSDKVALQYKIREFSREEIK